MASSSDNVSMAVFCDFENLALGVRDANYDKFDIKLVLERLLLKGSIVVKKAYCDWERYKGFKSTMHEANFELIEIPHVRQSGKNSADIRLVVDALDLCYTKSHVNTFVIISGDSDFSPLVSKLRENAKQVIGVGIKQSTSDLLVANCDEFIFYDDLVREVRRVVAKRDERKAAPQNNKRPGDDRRKEELEARKTQALEMVAETFDALVSERGDTGKIWASLLKDTLKRRRPEFSEVYYGFRTFGNLLEEAQSRGLFEFGRDEKSGTYVYRSSASAAALVEPAGTELRVENGAVATAAVATAAAPTAASNEPVAPGLAEAKGEGKTESRRRGGRGRKNSPRAEAPFVAVTPDEAASHTPARVAAVVETPAAPAVAAEADVTAAEAAPAKERRRAARKPTAKATKASAATDVTAAPEETKPAKPAKASRASKASKASKTTSVAESAPVAEPVASMDAAAQTGVEAKAEKPARKSAPRSRRPAKTKAAADNA